MLKTKRLRIRLASALLLTSAAGWAPAAKAQLITLGDVINALVNLDAQVTLLGQTVLDLDADIALQGTQIAAIQTDLTQVTNNVTLLQSDVSGLTTTVTAQGGQIVQNTADIIGLRNDLNANDALDTLQTARLDLQDAALSGLDARVTLGEAAIGVLDGRLDANELVDAAQDTALAGLDGRLDANDLVDAAQDTAIAGLDGRLDANELVDAVQDTAIAGLGGRLDANDLLDTAQNGRLDGHDAQLAAHDVRISTAQATADSAVGANTQLRSDVAAGRIGLVQQASAQAPITVGAGTGGTVVSFAGTAGNRRLSGVADGVAASDAATVGQMQAGDATTLAQANSYTDASLAQLGFDMNQVMSNVAARDARLRRDLDAAAAGSAALAGLPQAFEPGKGMVAMGVGGRGSQAAFALGVGKAFEGRHTPVLRAGAAVDTRRGSVTYNAAVGIHF